MANRVPGPYQKRSSRGAAPFDALAYNGLQLNGNMEVSQENAANSVILTGSGALQLKYLIDAVIAAYRGTFVAAGQQVTDAPPGYKNSIKLTVSTAQSSLGASDELSLLMPIIGTRASRLAFGVGSAAAVSVGVWVKANRTGLYSASLRNSAKNRSNPQGFTIDSANTWERKALTFTGDVTGTWLTDLGVGLSLNICIAGGSSRIGAAGWSASDLSGLTGTTNGVAATSDTFQATGLIVLPGIELPSSVRAPFIMRQFAHEWTDCRQQLRSSFLPGVAFAQNAGRDGAVKFIAQTGVTFADNIWIPFDVPMRAVPAITLYNPSAANTNFKNTSGGPDVAAAVPAEGNGINGLCIQTTGAASQTHLHHINYSAKAQL